MTDGFLPRRLYADLGEGEGDFDKAFGLIGVRHGFWASNSSVSCRRSITAPVLQKKVHAQDAVDVASIIHAADIDLEVLNGVVS